MEQARAEAIIAKQRSIDALTKYIEAEINNGSMTDKLYKQLNNRLHAEKRELLIVKGEIPKDDKKRKFRNGIYM